MENKTVQPPASPVKKRALLINRNFALLWNGGIVSRFGDFIFNVTLVLWIVASLAANQIWAPLAVSGVLVAATLPVLLLGPFAGVFVDRWKDKRGVMLRMDALRALLVALLLPINYIATLPAMVQQHISTPLLLGSIYGVVFLTSVCAQFFIPASQVVFFDILDEDDRTRASGLFQMISSFASILGPPLASLLYFTVGVQWALIINAASFLISFLALKLMHLEVTQEQGEKRNSFMHEFKEGIRFYVKTPFLVIALITLLLTVLWDGAFSALGVFFVSQNLQAPVSYYGFLGTAMGVGLTVGALSLGLVRRRIGELKVFCYSIILTGLLVIVYSRMTVFIPSLIVITLLGLLVAAVNVTFTPLLLEVTPRKLLGRVRSVVGPILNLSYTLSVSFVSWLDATVLHRFQTVFLGIRFTSIDTIFSTAGVLCLLSGIYALIKLGGMSRAEAKEGTGEIPQEEAAVQS
ncbi:MAG TPA: MFS transporter [Ktedonosporobacter sp.]|jgi:MFS family permease|nr:MFS transporter [Ktedonosporobacter sp.]